MAASARSIHTLWLLLVLTAVLGCGSDSPPTETPQGDNLASRQAGGDGGSQGDASSPAAPQAPATSGGAGSSVAAILNQALLDWQDPEPPEAQALAEQALHAGWNRDKARAIEGSTSRLEMHITTLQYSTSGITGLERQVVADGTTLEDRLRKLGAEVTDLAVTIRLAGSILFDFDKSHIRPDARRALEEVAAVLQAYGEAPVRIEGHTDAIGSDAYNENLSAARARSVADWLAAEGIESQRLEALGHGETQPVASNDSAEGRQLNRRVEIVVEREP